MNSYELSRRFWDWAFDNPELVKPIHAAIYFFAIEHCNRLGWKEKFGLPSQMVMEAIGVKNWRTYSAGLNDLVQYDFIEMIETNKNQYSANIIAIVNFTKAPTKALDKALSKHLQKHGTKHSQSTVSIDKQLNKEQGTTEQEKENVFPTFEIFLNHALEKANQLNIQIDELKVQSKFLAWSENGWKTLGDKQREIKNWKSTLNNSLQYLQKEKSNQPETGTVESIRQRLIDAGAYE